MKKRYVISALGAVTSAGLGYLLLKNTKVKNKTTYIRTLVNAGMPDQLNAEETDQLENAKMVSEGSQFGVHYFNQTIEDNKEKLEDQMQH